MDAFSGYDAWLEAPYMEEGPRCGACDGPMEWEEDGDEDGRYMVTWCEECD